MAISTETTAFRFRDESYTVIEQGTALEPGFVVVELNRGRTYVYKIARVTKTLAISENPTHRFPRIYGAYFQMLPRSDWHQSIYLVGIKTTPKQ